ncbi:hypothetical protein [Alkalibacillus haloalkaliphilus]|uniref:hypothetical protein n=1 Tax=Alkalibacillus haloalkaliphilus TaxID=94136 RepID=UPI002935C27D|nr:hypothetical protein [Alkalibacillus haloalkaliphilus]MDV2581989.1 hypothetical protein [Alkalibacillus haloalkaliphilus]
MSLLNLIVTLLSIMLLMAIPVEFQIHAPIVYYIITIPFSIAVIFSIVFESRTEKWRERSWDRIRKWKNWQGISFYIVINFVKFNLLIAFITYVVYGLRPVYWLADISINIKIFLTLIFLFFSSLIGVLTYYERGRQYGFKKLSEIMK